MSTCAIKKIKLYLDRKKKTSYDVALGRQNINYNQDYLFTYLPSVHEKNLNDQKLVHLLMC